MVQAIESDTTSSTTAVTTNAEDGTTPEMTVTESEERVGLTQVDSNEKKVEEALAEHLIPEKIIGSDDQIRVTDPTQDPYRKVVHLTMEFPDGGAAIGSGTMSGPDTVLTAAHNVYNRRLR